MSSSTRFRWLEYGVDQLSDVAIIGGGPGGSTCATMLRKLAPNLNVVLLERENFPREHVGESLLPFVSVVLDAMGCWEKVEAANFPVKVGATYKWGSSNDLWDFDFLGGQKYEDTPRPAIYAGQRRRTAFQVDRSIYDEILLNHAGSLGVEVRQNARVAKVNVDAGAVSSLQLEGGEIVKARYYIDASGTSAILRKALQVEVIMPTSLRNIAAWAYWENAEWAITLGSSGTRIMVMSLGWGWIWFIPVGSSRTSVGLVLPADYYKKSGQSLEKLYEESIQSEPKINSLLKTASRQSKVKFTRDWSLVSTAMADKNWLLVGDAGGFADPILSAGLTMTQASAWEAALTIAEIERGKHDREFLLFEYSVQQKRRIKTHIQFAEFWYRTNGHFSDLVEYTSKLAANTGIALDGKNAWQWLGTGGFIDSDLGGAAVGGFSLISASWLVQDFLSVLPKWAISSTNTFKLRLDGATSSRIAAYTPNEVSVVDGYQKADKRLPLVGINHFLVDFLQHHQRLDQLLSFLDSNRMPFSKIQVIQVLEALINDGWIAAEYDPAFQVIDVAKLIEKAPFHASTI